MPMVSAIGNKTGTRIGARVRAQSIKLGPTPCLVTFQ